MKLARQQYRLTKESEEYLEVIYKLQEKDGIAKTTKIAKQLNVALGSITNTIKCLKKKGLVEHTPYKGIKLTKKGVREALKVIRKHRLAERLLVDILKMKWSEAHEAACLLEHALTEEILQYVEKALNYPKKCPHGNPIPTNKGEIEEECSYPLHSLKVGKCAKIVKVTDESSEKLNILENYKIKPGKNLCLVNKSLDNGFIEIKVGKEHFKLNSDLATIIQVREKDE